MKEALKALLASRKSQAAIGAFLVALATQLLVKYAGMDAGMATDLSDKAFSLALFLMGFTTAEDMVKHFKGVGGAPNVDAPKE